MLSYTKICSDASPTLNAIVSVTESISDYIHHYENTIALLRTLARHRTQNCITRLVIFTFGCKNNGIGVPHGAPGEAPHAEDCPLNAPPFLATRAKHAPGIFAHSDVFPAVPVRPTNV